MTRSCRRPSLISPGTYNVSGVSIDAHYRRRRAVTGNSGPLFRWPNRDVGAANMVRRWDIPIIRA